MMQEQHTSPLGWLQAWAFSMSWPVIVVAAFALGRYAKGLEMRVTKAENSLQQIIERHLPAIHRALAEIRGLVAGGNRR
jgi:hypothetical protein